jgi:hypothetical protein
LFDLDGVLARTASVHAAAWKRLFDGFLARRAADTGEAFIAFDIDADYRRYVDGKPRYDGVVAFLASRGIAVPCGTPEDGPGTHTMHALGNLKDQYFLQHLEQHGVEVYEEAIALVQTLRAHEVKTAVVSSSNNCAAVLEVAVEPPSAWSLVFDGFDPACEGIREALCALGNGYFATRGAAVWAWADGIHYPGTYLAGGYNRLCTDIAGRVVENEDLVNFPNWLMLKFRIAEAAWFDARTVTILSYRQELDLRRGMLFRTIRFEDGQGRRTTLTERRLVSMGDMHLGALELALTAENRRASARLDRRGFPGPHLLG